MLIHLFETEFKQNIGLFKKLNPWMRGILCNKSNMYGNEGCKLLLAVGSKLKDWGPKGSNRWDLEN